MFRRRSLVVLCLGLCTCNPGAPDPGPGDPGPGDPSLPTPFAPVVNAAVEPGQLTLPDDTGTPRRVASSKDADGVQTDFVERIVLIRPTSQAQLDAFLARYNGVILGDNSIPEPPASLGITLTAAQRAATEYRVQISLDTVDARMFEAQASAAGLTGLVEFSTQDALLTMAGVADAVASGYDASPEFVSYPTQFPATLFGTQERPDGGGGFTDAFNTTRFQSTGSQTNVTLAWQYVMAHGIARRTSLAIVDGGYWLNPDGTARGADSDFPGNPPQYDFVQNDYFADGPGVTGCGPGNPCFWHGTGAAGVAAGILNNNQGAGGTGGLIADLMLFQVGGNRSALNRAIRTAIAWGADVVSMSWGNDCNLACRQYDRKDTPFSDAVGAGSRAVFVAAAGNGDAAGVGYDVGDPRFYHPCIEGHVICVGALNDDATTKIGYSNFGGQVAVFAPTNIPVMAQPASNDSNPNGPAAPRNFGGTSASTPFVAGVAAMMKALNPNLNSDQVGQIILSTAHPGAGQVTRYIDAYAAVRRAAEGMTVVKDRFDLAASNDINPTDLGSAASYVQADLNLDGRDRDYFKFMVPGNATMTVDLSYPEGLGPVRIFNIDALGECGEPVFIGETDLSGRGQRFTYRVAGGAHQIGITADDVNAYDLGISFAAGSVPADIYETNDTPATARRLRSLKSVGSGVAKFFGIDHRVTATPTIHNASDVDFFIVRGVAPGLAERVFINGSPTLQVYGNESPLAMQVYTLNEDNTQGALVANLTGQSCSAEPLSVGLTADVYYLVRISGTPGRYTLRNGVTGPRIRIPARVRDRIYVILNPGEPIEHLIRFTERYVFVHNPAYKEIRLPQNTIATLYDSNDALVRESVSSFTGGLLDLSGLTPNAVYSMDVGAPVSFTDGQVLRFEWVEADPVTTSENLIRNPGAELQNDGLLDWDLGDPPGSYLSYDNDEGYPNADSPGPPDRGQYFFYGFDYEASTLRQDITLSAAWQQAVSGGDVQFTLSAFLGGLLDEEDYATVQLFFFRADDSLAAAAALPPVTARDREGVTGLFPVQTEGAVPAGTARIRVVLTFVRADGDYADGFADNLELILRDYTP